MRIAQLANFYAPASGGLRTTLDALGRGYVAAGHDRLLVVPGARYARVRDAAGGVRVTVPGPRVGGGYRMVLSPGVLRGLRRLLGWFAPDVLEVSDKLTLVGTARWARARGVRSVLLSHERLDAILAPRLPGRLPPVRAVDAWNRRLAGAFDAVVAASAFSGAEFARLGGQVALHRVPLGVDLEVFAPAGAWGGGVRLVYAGRLSAEKWPHLPLEALAVLRRRGVDARLDVLGDGPERGRLERWAATAGLPVRFHGHVAERRGVAAVLARADVALVPCAVESFGLSALEALACGTPVVTADRGAARELVVPGAGAVAPAGCATGMADAVTRVLARPEEVRRAAARARAEEFPWARTVERMLAVHANAGRADCGPPGVR